MPPAHLPLFAFGTLRRGEENHHCLAGAFDGVRVARLCGFRLATAAHGYPAVEVSPGSEVVGEVFFLSADRYVQTMRRCDDLEDIPEGAESGEYYRRAVVTVETSEGPLRAWAYLSPTSSTESHST